MPSWAVGVVALGSVVAQTAVLLVFQLGQPRILFAMARDGLLPPVFARVHPRFGTPHVSTILTGVLVGVVSAFASIDEMVDLTNIGTLFAFILVCIGIIILRFREPGRRAAVPRALRAAARAAARRRVVPRAHALPAAHVVDALRRVAARGAGRLRRVRLPATRGSTPRPPPIDGTNGETGDHPERVGCAGHGGSTASSAPARLSRSAAVRLSSDLRSRSVERHRATVRGKRCAQARAGRRRSRGPGRGAGDAGVVESRARTPRSAARETSRRRAARGPARRAPAVVAAPPPRAAASRPRAPRP